MSKTQKTILKNSNLQKMLAMHPDDAEIHIHVDGETSELQLDDARVEYIPDDHIVLITMDVSNIPW